MTNLLEQAVQGTVRNEEWKYTSVLHLLKNTYSAIPRAEPASVPAAGDTIVVENGVVTRLCDGATVEPTITRHDAVRSTATASPFFTAATVSSGVAYSTTCIPFSATKAAWMVPVCAAIGPEVRSTSGVSAR